MNSIIIANWKMSMSLSQATDLARLLESSNQSRKLLIAPPTPYLTYLASILVKTQLCAQDVSTTYGFGPHTGEASADIIKSCGVNYSIVGHSERRLSRGETNKTVYEKSKNCTRAGIIPIICVGETQEARQNNVFKEFIIDQINSSVPPDAEDIIIAYEPIWAIGSGVTPSIEQISEVVELIKNEVKLVKVAKAARLVYGGSVNSKNFVQILRVPGLNGLLIGSASGNWSEMSTILKSEIIASSC